MLSPSKLLEEIFGLVIQSQQWQSQSGNRQLEQEQTDHIVKYSQKAKNKMTEE